MSIQAQYNEVVNSQQQQLQLNKKQQMERLTLNLTNIKEDATLSPI